MDQCWGRMNTLLEKPGFLFHDYHGLLNVLKELIDYCNLTKGSATVLYKNLSKELGGYHNDVEWDVQRPGGPKCFWTGGIRLNVWQEN